MTATVFKPIAGPQTRDWKRSLEALEMHAQALERVYAAVASQQAEHGQTSDIVEIGFGPVQHQPRPCRWAEPAMRRSANWVPEVADRLVDLEALPAYPGYANAAMLLNARVTIGVFIAEADEPAIESIVNSVFLAQRDRKDFAPVFVTESANFQPLAKRGYVFEYLPPVPEEVTDPERAASWRQERLDLIQAKWGISYFISDVRRIADRLALGRARQRVVVFPDYGAGNPYLELMYRDLRRDWDVSFDTAAAAAIAAEHGPTVFHLHWEDAVYRGERADAIPQRMATFIAAIDRIKHLGGRFVWTVHNLQPHDPIDPTLHAEFVRQLVARADIVHANSQWVADKLCDDHGADLPVCVIDHPSYATSYPACEDRAAAAAALDLASDDDRPTVLFLGLMRRYKGVDRLLNVAPRFADKARFVVAGRSGRYDPCGSLPDNCTRVEGFADDLTVARLFSVADFVVLPFESLTTSGSLLLALSFAKPLIVPNLDAVKEVVVDGREAFVYDPAIRDGLADAIERALDAPDWQRAAMSKAAEATASFRAPEAFSRSICDMYARLETAEREAGRVNDGADDPSRPNETGNVTVMTFDRRAV